MIQKLSHKTDATLSLHLLTAYSYEYVKEKQININLSPNVKSGDFSEQIRPVKSSG